MLKKLIQIQKLALPILSNYKVAAILITKDGDEINGVNIESYIPSSSVCAERNAIFSAISLGYDKQSFTEIHVLGGPDDNYIISPCGQCRQFIYEFIPNAIIFMYNKKNEIIKSKIGDLLPMGFVK